MQETSQIISALAGYAVDIIRVIVSLVFMVLVVPWIKNSLIPWAKDKQIYTVIKRFVRAAEKRGEAGTIRKDSKLDYVVTLLEKRGVHVNEEVRAMIESAVGELDDEFATHIGSIIHMINDTDEDTEEEAN